MKATIVIPIIRFNEYSRYAMKRLSSIPQLENLKFLFAVSSPEIEAELRFIIDDFQNEYIINVCNSTDSNQLRKQAIHADTEFIYYNDCDDWADYELINSEVGQLRTTDTVVCYQTERLIVKDLNNIHSGGIITRAKQGIIDRIENFPVSVYSKLIPTKFLKCADFPNLPFTQDWAISYSLFLIVPHRMVEKISYFYYNYPTSSSNSIYDTVHRLNRVNVYGDKILRRYKQLRSSKDYEFLKYRYNTTLGVRYKKLGINIKPYTPSLTTFLKVTFQTKLEITNQTLRKYFRLLKK